MTLNIEKALLSPFSDKDWTRKFFILILLSVVRAISISLRVNLLAWILTIISGGYFMCFMNNEIHGIKPLLPCWSSNYFNYFKKGLIVTIIATIYMILSFPIMYFLFNLTSDFDILIGFYLLLLVCFFVSALYCDNFEFREAFALRKLLRIMINAKKDFLIIILIISTLFIGCFFASIELLEQIKLSKFIFGIIVALSTPYFLLFINNLIAQAYKSGKEI